MDTAERSQGAHRTRPMQGNLVTVLTAAVTFVALAGAGAAVVRNNALAYRSSSVLTIDQPQLIAASRDAGPILKLVNLRTQYAELLTTSALAAPIAAQVGASEAWVAQHVTAVAAPNSLLIDVQADAPTAERAVALSRAATGALVTYAQTSQTKYHVPANERIILSVATPAARASRITRSLRTAVTVGVFLGALGAAVVVAAASIVTRRRW